MIRAATPDDADDLARIHVTSWRETYTGLLPEAEITSRSLTVRRQQWQNQIAAGTSRIMLLPGLGFAQAGPQREAALAKTYPQEVYALYLLASAQGTGQGAALLHAATTDAAMTALALATNLPAIQFYRRTGAKILETRIEHIGQAEVRDHLLGWDAGWKSSFNPANAAS